MLGGRICFIHYQLYFGFDEFKGLKCILATQKPIKSVQNSSEGVWIGRIVYDKVLEKGMVYSEEVTSIDMIKI